MSTSIDTVRTDDEDDQRYSGTVTESCRVCGHDAIRVSSRTASTMGPLTDEDTVVHEHDGTYYVHD